jgi:hypothetical protein
MGRNLLAERIYGLEWSRFVPNFRYRDFFGDPVDQITPLDPAPVLEPCLELVCNCIGGRLGSCLESILAGRLPVQFNPANDNQADRIAVSNRHGGGHDHPRGFAFGGADR